MKPIKLTQGQLRSIVMEASNEHSTAREVSLYLEEHAPDLSPDEAEDARRAVHGMEFVRRFFRGSKWEDKLTEMIILCDEFVDFAMHGEEY